MINLRLLQIGIITWIITLMALTLYCFIKRKVYPNLIDAISLLTGCTGVITGVAFGYKACTLPSDKLGDLQDHRLPIIIGAVVVIWIAGEQVYKQFFNRDEKRNEV